MIKDKMKKHLLSVMKDKDISRNQLSRLYGCSTPYISRILGDKQEVSIDVLIDLLEICGCNVEVNVRY